MTDRELLQQALEALTDIWNNGIEDYPDVLHKQIIDNISDYLAQPVAQCRTDGRCQYAIDHGAEGLGACPSGKCCMPVAQGPVAWKQKLVNILCRIHRDGGQYIAEHGWDKAIDDADIKVAQMYAAQEAPAQEQYKSWQGLTKQEVHDIQEKVFGAVPHHVAYAMALQEKLREKNEAVACATPPQRKPLTDEEEREKFNQWFNSFYLTNWQEENQSEVLARWIAWQARAKLAVTPQRKPLTDEEIEAFAEQIGIDFDGCIAFARAIEATHNIGEKNDN